MPAGADMESGPFGGECVEVAVDCGTLTVGGGISRYLKEMLLAVSQSAGEGVRFRIYGRSSRQLADMPPGLSFETRQDHLPVHVGRILSLFLSLPFWLWRDRPALYWGPAHRLPLFVPSDVPCVVTVHDLCWAKCPRSMRRVTRWLDRWLMGRAVGRASAVIAVSRATAEDLSRLYPHAREKTFVVYEGGSIPSPRRAQKRPDRSRNDEGHFLFVGTFEPRKNLQRLISAYATALKHEQNLPSLVLVGGLGWGGVDVERMIAELDLGEKVRCLGRVSDDHLQRLYSDAVALVMPSLYEGFGLPLVEAMAYGKPLLTSSVASMPEIAGDAAVLVDPLAVDSIADGLLTLARDAELRQRLGAAALARAAEFDWAQAGRQTLSIFMHVARRTAR